MNNETIVKNFFEAFQKLDSKTMNSFLAKNISFDDPAFGKLNGDEVKYMWQFLTKNAKNFSLEFEIISTTKNKLEAKWTAHYTFSATGNKVVNHVNSSFTIKNDKITNHKDEFDLKKWAKQALGKAIGIFGPSFLLKKGIQAQSKQLLKKYMSKNELLE
ncbi:MAG: nuclear transport factor 2 family protein [Chitinophagales bacterium]